MSMGTQLFVAILGFSFARGLSSDQYFVNLDSGSLTSQPFVYNYQPESVYQQYPNPPNDINKPIFHKDLGMAPQYHNLVYNYIKEFAGAGVPQFVNTPNNFQVQNQFYPQNSVPVQNENNKGQTPTGVTDKPGLNDYFLPSDMLSLPYESNNQLRRNFDVFKTKKMKPGARPTSLPPIGGVVSNYVLLRSQPSPNDLHPFFGQTKAKEANLSHIKRESPDDEDDSVVIFAESSQNTKNTDEASENKEKETEESKESEEEGEGDEEDSEEESPSIAQSKPSAIALAGPGGVAQASPVATALVGPGGLAVSAPSGTAIAGRRQENGPIAIGEEKQKDKDEE
ncbi:hypothetical protein RUM44_013561 [Polyplax serrata]|uniref:DUF4774 domain-containing protein n=1 Tax=Polyplax serrata TaxID=468196 RepID=A0ABR1BJ72_POLSC